jgi:HSP20 family protein
MDDWFAEPRHWRDEDRPGFFGRKHRFLSPDVRTPRMDIYETEKEVIVKVELPGVDPKDIEVEVQDNILKIEAKTEQKKEEKKKGYYRKEISSGFYKRAVPLPAEVIGNKAKASYTEGVLKIEIPKAKPKKEKKKTIKIKVKSTKTA